MLQKYYQQHKINEQNIEQKKDWKKAI